MMLDRKRVGLVVLCFALMLSVTVVSAELSTSSSTSYEGGQEANDQAITVTYTFSPDGSKISNVVINFRAQQRTLLQGGTFSYTVQPGAAEINVTNAGRGEFRIDELGKNEEITFTYTVYPKNIKQESIEASSVDIQYVQNGQELTHEETITANLSSSPWYQLQEKQDQLESEQSGQAVSLGIFAGALGFGVLGLIAAGVSYRRIGSRVQDEHDTFSKELERVKSRIDSPGAERKIQDLIDKYQSDGGAPGPTPAGDQSGGSSIDDDDEDDDGGLEPPSV
ncbi:hypothetical protein [Halorubellus salinus]|uniref:hypothetical protein n=1 Tax=Halorubellus salinus TaxID=755309 RepID=UPI001D086884|nr:hypothetical protein [Halorubellus salinus]